MQNHLNFSFGRVFELSKECKLSESFFTEAKTELTNIAQSLEISENQAFVLSIVLSFYLKEGCVTVQKIIEYLNCNPLKFMELMPDMFVLRNKEIVAIAPSWGGRERNFIETPFIISDTFIYSLSNTPRAAVGSFEIETFEIYMERCMAIGKKCKNGEIYFHEFHQQMTKLMSQGVHFPLVKKLVELELGQIDFYLFFYVVHRALAGIPVIFLCSEIDYLLPKQTGQLHQKQLLVSGESYLIKSGLIDVETNALINEAAFTLSNYTKHLLSKQGIVLRPFFSNNTVVEPGNIALKQLIFNDKTNESYKKISSVLDPTNYSKIIEQLAQENHSAAFSVLFYGSSGTGKTEAVYQIAKASGRAIVKLDIGKIYSERFGQSEKNLQNLFDRYYEYAAYKGVTPILFLDNADAFLSSRTSDSATIIIQETLQQMLCVQLDNPEMIFIATAKNLNLLTSEFTNRIIYKIELQNPSTTVSPTIWKSNFPQLTEQQCLHLSQQYRFSPRQIENIAIQCLLEECIDNQKMNIADIERICTSSS